MLESIDGRPVEAPKEIFFEIAAGSVSGYDGCNHFGGRLDALDEMRATQRGCPPDVLQIRLAGPESPLKSLEVRGDTIELRVSNGLARFRRSKAR